MKCKPKQQALSTAAGGKDGKMRKAYSFTRETPTAKRGPKAVSVNRL